MPTDTSPDTPLPLAIMLLAFEEPIRSVARIATLLDSLASAETVEPAGLGELADRLFAVNDELNSAWVPALAAARARERVGPAFPPPAGAEAEAAEAV